MAPPFWARQWTTLSRRCLCFFRIHQVWNPEGGGCRQRAPGVGCLPDPCTCNSHSQCRASTSRTTQRRTSNLSPVVHWEHGQPAGNDLRFAFHCRTRYENPHVCLLLLAAVYSISTVRRGRPISMCRLLLRRYCSDTGSVRC